jgi:hypothetical protein
MKAITFNAKAAKLIGVAALAFSTLLALSACGGGGSNPTNATAAGTATSGGGSSSSSPSSGGASSGSNSGFVYETAINPTTRADMLAQANSEGARGFAFVSPIGFPGDNGAIYALYAKRIGSANTYTYEILDAPSTAAGVLAQANAEGARGFRRGDELVVGTAFVHVVGSTESFTYESLPTATTSASFLSQVNSEGARGFLYEMDDGAGGALSSLYVKNSASTATYNFVSQPAVFTADAIVAQANAQGAQGYRFKTSYVLTDATIDIYVKDMTASSTFTALTQPAVNQAAAYVSQANAEGATGAVLFGELTGGSTPNPFVFYFTPHSCTGELCAIIGPLGG